MSPTALKAAVMIFSRMMLSLFLPEKSTVQSFMTRTLMNELSFTFPKDIQMVTGQIHMIYPNVYPKPIRNSPMFCAFRLLEPANLDRLHENLNILLIQKNTQMSCITISFFWSLWYSSIVMLCTIASNIYPILHPIRK